MIIESKRYSIDEVFQMIGEEHLNIQHDHHAHQTDMIVNGFNVHPQSLRYATFYQKGVKCVCCGKEGAYFQLCGEENSNRRHFNLYTEEGILMTKDHIIPKSKGGQNRVSNLQPMCVDCNKAKASQCDEVKREYIVGINAQGKELVFSTIEKASYHLTITAGKANAKGIKKEDAIKIGIKTVINLQSAIEYNTSYCGYIWKKEMR